MRNSGIKPTWENYVAQGKQRGLDFDQTQAEQFERLWCITLDLCQDVRDQHYLDFALVYMASLNQPGLHPNPAAFALTNDEADRIRSVVNRYS
jgi:hypothetical protein